MNKNFLMKEVPTFRSGTYTLSARHDSLGLKSLMNQVETLAGIVSETPSFPEDRKRLLTRLRCESVFASAAIEGNPTSEDDAMRLLEADHSELSSALGFSSGLSSGGFSSAGFSSEGENTTGALHPSEKELINLAYGFDKLPLAEGSRIEISEALIVELNNMIVSGKEAPPISKEPYRADAIISPAAEQATYYTPPKIVSDIRVLIKGLVNWINTDDVIALGPEVRAALLHYHILLAVPFDKMSGATARLLETFILRSSGRAYTPEMLVVHYYRHKERYLSKVRAVMNRTDHDLTEFLRFVLEGHVEALKGVRERFAARVKCVMLVSYLDHLRELKKLTKRQHQLGAILLGNTAPFSLSDLYKAPHLRLLYGTACERTGRRDIKRLSELGLLISVGEGRYVLNLDVLGGG